MASSIGHVESHVSTQIGICILPKRHVQAAEISLRPSLRTFGSIIGHHVKHVDQRVGVQVRREHRLRVQAGGGKAEVAETDSSGSDMGGFDVEDDSDASIQNISDDDEEDCSDDENE
jgi:hypothetical protein